MLKLHFAPNSRAGRIVWLLEELELPYELNRMDFHPKDLKSDTHRARRVCQGKVSLNRPALRLAYDQEPISLFQNIT